MKRFLIFSVAYHPFVGGAEIAVKEITDRITNIQFDMITINLDGKQKAEEQIGNVHVYRIGRQGKLSKLFFPFTACLKAGELHKKNKYDAIWSIMASFSGFAAVFFKMMHSKIPFILNLQEGDPIPYIKRQVWFVYPLFQQIFRRANVIHALSHYLADFARDMGAKGIVEVIPNGVNPELFSKQYSPEEIKIIRTELGLFPEDKVLITTSRLVKKNGVGDVIATLPLLPEQVKFVIIGIGKLEEELKAQVKALNLERRVVFAGLKPNNNLPGYLAASDIFIRPSLSEGQGISFIEAMAAGIPIIATPVGGIPDFLKDNETGLFCEVQNPKSIAEKVTMLLENPELRATLTKNAKALVAEKYNWDLIAEMMKIKVFSIHLDT
ncbi:MAG: glycosyltransferase family 4 protein [bacterium]|nr:glycosyltransferase family 4 protein [bacterium]